MSIEIKFKEKLSSKSKFAYGSANTAGNILSGMAFSAITFYYNVKLGLDAQLIGIAWLIFAFWNAINDPLFGYIEDRTKTDKGRRTPYIRYGAPVFGLLFILCWIPLVDISNELALFAYFLFILFAFDTIFTIVVLIIYILPAEMAITSKERASLMVYATLIGAFGYVITYMVPILFLTGEESTGIDPIFITAMIIVGIACALVIFISSYYLKEYKFAQIEEPLSVVPAVKECFKNKPFITYETSSFCLSIASTILTAAMFYYIYYILELEGFMTIIPLVIVILMVFIFAYVVSLLVQKKGLKKVFILGQIIIGIGFTMTFFLGWDLITAIPCFIMIGIGTSISVVIAPLILADTIDFDETRTNKRRETTYTGIEALIVKPSISVANWLFLLIISIYGFQEAAKTQSDSALLGIMIGFTLIPAVFAFLSAIIMKFYTLDGPKWTEQKLKLQELHDQKEKDYFNYLKEQGKI
ncbi:MAG: MFS transporter [Candidatus Hermodarchaeota archaeon]